MSRDRSRQLRRDQTPAERRFWQIVYTFRKTGFHFRRQAQIGPYYVDFVCHHAALVVEIDGDTHGTDEAMAYDARRTTYLAGRGYSVLRFTNNDVLGNAEGVFAVLSAALRDRTPTPTPPRKGEGSPTESFD
ncbi:endonuclease domain-containing protein [Devosia lacusdianchii]|uniref:endonuclease domain-containing protein n=1 Tax=Devosia lacusdianchii TaxID=2917991 RepID=UPI001F0638E9|nr:DUF559 domain-containing protein [Devosia sp. JXJ CY 41]